MLRTIFYSRNALTLDDEQLAIEELAMYKRAGGSTIVDLTLDGLGRNPPALKRISESSGINIVMGTGFYIESSHPPRVNSGTVDSLADEMIRDIQIGVGETGIRAGVIGELGISPGVVLPQEEKVLRAAAIAQTKTRRPINVHTWGDPPDRRTQNKVMDILEEEGASLEKVALSHMEQVKKSTKEPTPDWDYVCSLAGRGPYVSLDAFGQDWPWGADWAIQNKNVVYMPSPTDFDRAKGVMTLIEKGFEKKILLSHDVWHKLRLKRYGGDGYDHLLTNVTRIFKSLGITDDLIHQLMEQNPRAFLE
jgi:phosphotriesterase-related protein